MKKLFGGAIICLVFLFTPVISSLSLNAQQTPAGTESYYVRANGDDKNDGLSEKKPFKTLTRALNVASRSSIKKITVIGKLVESVSTEDMAASLTGRKNWDDANPSEVLVTGKPEAKSKEKAVLTVKKGHILTVFNLLAIRLEHIEISGANGAAAVRVMGGELTLANGVKIFNNENLNGGSGGGVFLTHGGFLIMRDNAEISNNQASVGGGFSLGDEGGGTSAILLDNALVAKNKAANGGGVVVGNSELVMKDDASVNNNSAVMNGGGINIQGGEVTLYDNANIRNNFAIGNRNNMRAGGLGAGIFILNGKVTLRGNSLIDRNQALLAGGGICGWESAEIIFYDSPKITGNRSEMYAGGVSLNKKAGGSLKLGPNVNLKNVIFNNEAPENPDLLD